MKILFYKFLKSLDLSTLLAPQSFKFSDFGPPLRKLDPLNFD